MIKITLCWYNKCLKKILPTKYCQTILNLAVNSHGRQENKIDT